MTTNNYIFKYEIPFKDESVVQIDLPENAAICDLAYQEGSGVMMWALIDKNANFEKRKFVVFGTGWRIDDIENFFYLKTIQFHGFVWHIFEVMDKTNNDLCEHKPDGMIYTSNPPQNKCKKCGAVL